VAIKENVQTLRKKTTLRLFPFAASGFLKPSSYHHCSANYLSVT